MAAMSSGGAFSTAARAWETDWDEDDQTDQTRQKVRRAERPATPSATQSAAPPFEIPDSWDEADPGTLVDNLLVDVLEAKQLTDGLAETFAAKPFPAREVEAPAVKDIAPAVKAKSAIEKRYWGTVRLFRGCYGW